MNRRSLLLTSAAAAAAASASGCRVLGGPRARHVPGLPTPNPAQFAWQQAELGIIFHYDLHLFDDERYVQQENRRRRPPSLEAFDPPRLDSDRGSRPPSRPARSSRP